MGIGHCGRSRAEDRCGMPNFIMPECGDSRPRLSAGSDRSSFVRAPSELSSYDPVMHYKLRFLWNATKGHHLAPWRSPYLLWRIETYTGVKMTQIGFMEFWEFVWRERGELWRFLKWTGEMERYVHPKPKSS